MPEVDHSELESEQGDTKQPFAGRDIENLRDGNTPEPTMAEKRQRFMDQASATLRREAERHTVAAETLLAQPHKDGDMIELGAEDEREKAARLREEADHAEQEAAAQFDAEHSS